MDPAGEFNQIVFQVRQDFANGLAIQKFPNAEYAIFFKDILDHCLLLVQLGSCFAPGKHQFNFFNMWANYESFRKYAYDI